MEEELEKIAKALAELEQKIMARNAEFAANTANMQKEIENTGKKYLDLRAVAGTALKQLDTLIDEMEKEK